MTNKNDALPVVASWLQDEVVGLDDLSSSACQMALGNGVGEHSFLSLARTVRDRCVAVVSEYAATRDTELAALWETQRSMSEQLLCVTNERDQLQAELAALRAKPAIQVDYVAVMRDNGDGGLKPEWLMEGDTAEMMAGMYLCCLDGGSLLFEEGSGQVCAAPLVSDKAGAVVLPQRIDTKNLSHYAAVQANRYNEAIDDFAALNLLAADVAPKGGRYCNKCGYCGPMQTHNRLSDGVVCEYMACDVRAKPVASDVVSVPREFVLFLLGEAELDGIEFGAVGKPPAPGISGKWWWRPKLRALLATRQEGSKV